MTDLERALALIDQAQRDLKRQCIGFAIAIVLVVPFIFFAAYPLLNK